MLGSSDSCTNDTQRNIKRKNGLINKKTNLKIGLAKLTSQIKLTPTRSNQDKSTKTKSSTNLNGANSVNGQNNQEAFISPSTIGGYIHNSNLHQGFNQTIFVHARVITHFSWKNRCFYQSKFWSFFYWTWSRTISGEDRNSYAAGITTRWSDRWSHYILGRSRCRPDPILCPKSTCYFWTSRSVWKSN